jgi:hypothetical protein
VFLLISPSFSVAVFDVLLPAKSDAYPILLPQPPAYTPALFPSAELALRLAAPSTFVTTCEPTTQRNATEDEASETSEQELQSLVALSSCNYPLINLLTAPSDGALLGRHNISDAVKERLPLLIESGETRNNRGESVSSQQGRDGKSAPTSPARDATTLRDSRSHISDDSSIDNNSLERQLPRVDSLERTKSFDWWKWVSVFAVFFMTGTLARIGVLRLRRWRAQQLPKEKVALHPVLAVRQAEPVTNDKPTSVPTLGEAIDATRPTGILNDTENSQKTSPDASGGKALQMTPITPRTSESAERNKLPTLSPGQESEDLPQRTFKKRRRKRGKGKGKGKLEYADSDEELDGEQKQRMDSSPERSPKLLKNGLQLEVDAKPLAAQTLGAAIGAETGIIKRKDVLAKLDGLTVSDDVLGEFCRYGVDFMLLIVNSRDLQDMARKALSCSKAYFKDVPWLSNGSSPIIFP